VLIPKAYTRAVERGSGDAEVGNGLLAIAAGVVSARMMALFERFDRDRALP
jgi:hypothetical protein